jgi:hypothetical protein
MPGAALGSWRRIVDSVERSCWNCWRVTGISVRTASESSAAPSSVRSIGGSSRLSSSSA